MNKKTKSEQCILSNECDLKLHLECSNKGTCECLKGYYWYDGQCSKENENNCFNDEWCYNNIQGSFCNKANKKCECIKEIGNENYWDVLHGKCIPASGYNKTCHNDSACQALTQHTICNASSHHCDCPSGKYWNGTRCGEIKLDCYLLYLHQICI